MAHREQPKYRVKPSWTALIVVVFAGLVTVAVLATGRGDGENEADAEVLPETVTTSSTTTSTSVPGSSNTTTTTTVEVEPEPAVLPLTAAPAPAEEAQPATRDVKAAVEISAATVQAAPTKARSLPDVDDPASVEATAG